jgi:1,4-alpha-glucan branching enzyme
MINPSPRNSKFKQGYYHPKNIEKLIGHDIPMYRSGIELEFMRWLDSNDKVVRWSSEGVTLQYYDPMKKRQRTYFTDNYVEIQEGDSIKKYIIELKSEKETRKPDPRSKKKKAALLIEQSTWITNNAKWKYATKFARDHNMEFLLLAHTKKDGFVPVKLDFLV